MTVEEIQRALIARGYDLGKAGADGDAGPNTIAALTAFQKSVGCSSAVGSPAGSDRRPADRNHRPAHV